MITARNALVDFVNNHSAVVVPHGIASLVDEGDIGGAMRAILALDTFDCSDFAEMQPNLLDALRAASATDILGIFQDGQTFKVGTLRLNDLLREFGTTVWGNLRTGEGAVIEMEGGGFIAVSGDCWDIVDLFEDGPQGDGWYSIKTDGSLNGDGWLFCARTHFVDADEIIDEEGMGYDSVGSVESLTISDDGHLTDGHHSEKADFSSAAAFRQQVRRWKAAVSDNA
jgi:hypothetical protein